MPQTLQWLSNASTTTTYIQMGLTVCVQPSTAAVTWHCPHLLLWCCWLLGAHHCWSISPARGAPSSKPDACHCYCRSMGQTDRQTDTRPLRRPCSEYYANSANKSNVNYQLPAATRKQHNQSHVRRCLFWLSLASGSHFTPLDFLFMIHVFIVYFKFSS